MSVRRPLLILALLASVPIVWSFVAAADQAPKAAGPAAEEASGASLARGVRVATRSRSDAIKEVLPSSVRVAVSANGKQLRAASGVVVASGLRDGVRVSHILTNAHVVHGPKARIDVLVDRAGRTSQSEAKVVAVGEVPELDLAVLEVSGLEVQPAALVADSDLELGDEVVAIGAPYGKGLSVSSGIVSQLELDESGTAIGLKTDAPIGYGASGGGIFRVSDGALLAVVEGYRTVKVSFPVDGKNISFDVPMPGETFGVPAAKIRSFLREEGLAHLLGEELVGPPPAQG